MWVKVTYALTGEKLLVNLDHVESVNRLPKDGTSQARTALHLRDSPDGSSNTYRIMESFEDVELMLMAPPFNFTSCKPSTS